MKYRNKKIENKEKQNGVDLLSSKLGVFFPREDKFGSGDILSRLFPFSSRPESPSVSECNIFPGNGLGPSCGDGGGGGVNS